MVGMNDEPPPARQEGALTGVAGSALGPGEERWFLILFLMS